MNFRTYSAFLILLLTIFVSVSSLYADTNTNSNTEMSIHRLVDDEPYNESRYHASIREHMRLKDYEAARAVAYRLRDIHPESSTASVVLLHLNELQMNGGPVLEKNPYIDFETRYMEAVNADKNKWLYFGNLENLRLSSARVEDMKQTKKAITLEATLKRTLRREANRTINPICETLPGGKGKKPDGFPSFHTIKKEQGVVSMLQAFESYLADHPEAMDVHQYYVHQLFLNGQFMRAYQVNEAALKRFPKDPKFQFFQEHLGTLNELQSVDAIRIQFQRSLFAYDILDDVYRSCVYSNIFDEAMVDLKKQFPHATVKSFRFNEDTTDAEVQEFIDLFAPKEGACCSPNQ